MQSRRDFVRNAGMAAAGAVVLPACTGGGAQKDNASTQATPEATSAAELRANWKIGLQVYTLRDAMEQNPRATIDYIAQVGYDEVELYGYKDGSYFGMPAKNFYKITNDAGLSIRSAHYLTGRVEADWSGTMLKGWDRAIEDAVAAGQSHMALSWLPESERSLEYYQTLPDLLNRAGEQCKAAGLQLAYHNHDFEFKALEDLMPMYHILDNTDPEFLKMELDLYWITLAGGDPLEFFQKYPGRTELWHVKDIGVRDGETTTFEVGEGSIDFTKIFAESSLAGLQAFFVEQDHSPNPKESISTSYKNLQRMLS